MVKRVENGAIAWEGASLIDGKPIVVILTGFKFTSNRKLGSSVIQSWILRADQLPIDALNTEEDRSICGDCPLRRKICYVNLLPVQNIYRKYAEGAYPILDAKHLNLMRYKLFRACAYGDPSAVPFEVWEFLAKNSDRVVGYTHSWNSPWCDPRLKDYFLASVESEEGARLAASMGWKYYRVKAKSDPFIEDEIPCPHTVNPRIQCEDCGLCTAKRRSGNIVVDVHGLDFKIRNFEKVAAV